MSEFRFHGELTPRPDPSTTTPAEWRRYLYMQENTNGWSEENWYHSAGCRKFIKISRNKTTNETSAGSAR